MKSRRSHDSPMIAADRSLLWRFCAGGNARKVTNEDTSAFQAFGETFGEASPRQRAQVHTRGALPTILAYGHAGIHQTGERAPDFPGLR